MNYTSTLENGSLIIIAKNQNLTIKILVNKFDIKIKNNELTGGQIQLDLYCITFNNTILVDKTTNKIYAILNMINGLPLNNENTAQIDTALKQLKACFDTLGNDYNIDVYNTYNDILNAYIDDKLN